MSIEIRNDESTTRRRWSSVEGFKCLTRLHLVFDFISGGSLCGEIKTFSSSIRIEKCVFCEWVARRLKSLFTLKITSSHTWIKDFRLFVVYSIQLSPKCFTRRLWWWVSSIQFNLERAESSWVAVAVVKFMKKLNLNKSSSSSTSSHCENRLNMLMTSSAETRNWKNALKLPISHSTYECLELTHFTIHFSILLSALERSMANVMCAALV